MTRWVRVLALLAMDRFSSQYPQLSNSRCSDTFSQPLQALGRQATHKNISGSGCNTSHLSEKANNTWQTNKQNPKTSLTSLSLTCHAALHQLTFFQVKFHLLQEAQLLPSLVLSTDHRTRASYTSPKDPHLLVLMFLCNLFPLNEPEPLTSRAKDTIQVRGNTSISIADSILSAMM